MYNRTRSNKWHEENIHKQHNTKMNNENGVASNSSLLIYIKILGYCGCLPEGRNNIVLRYIGSDLSIYVVLYLKTPQH
jgi:hypothetical protein